MIAFHLEIDGNEYHAWASGLPGCHTHGKTKEEALRNLKNAVLLYLEDMLEENLLSEEMSLSTAA